MPSVTSLAVRQQRWRQRQRNPCPKRSSGRVPARPGAGGLRSAPFASPRARPGAGTWKSGRFSFVLAEWAAEVIMTFCFSILNVAVAVDVLRNARQPESSLFKAAAVNASPPMSAPPAGSRRRRSLNRKGPRSRLSDHQGRQRSGLTDFWPGCGAHSPRTSLPRS